MTKWVVCLILFSLSMMANSDAVVESDQRLSLDFNQVPTRELLLNLARFSHKNIFISQNIQGEMSIHVDQLPWSDVLQYIVHSQGLSLQQIGPITYIEPLADQEQFEQSQSLQQQTIFLTHTRAIDIATLIKAQTNLLSKRGSVSADSRTNSLWLEDLPAQMPRLQNFIRSLDVALPEISIEARIVTIDTQHEQDLGFQFGLSSLHHLSGTLVGANAAQQNNIGQVPVNERLNFNLPATPSDGPPASIGLAMAKLTDGYYLDLELSALEAQGVGKVIASPNLMVTDQQTATIEAGEEIPYQEKTSSGATNVAFKKAVLSLQVTPQIIHQQQILLTLKINQDRVSAIEVNGVPAIDTREITTQILSRNHQIIVLGGIYETDNQYVTKRVPFISDLPLIGPLFTYQHDASQKRELLIFVRPTLVDEQN